MRGNLNLIFSAQEFAMNEGEIIGMNMDLFGTTEIHMRKWSIGHSIQLPANAELLPTIKAQRLSSGYFKLRFSVFVHLFPMWISRCPRTIFLSQKTALKYLSKTNTYIYIYRLSICLLNRYLYLSGNNTLSWLQ